MPIANCIVSKALLDALEDPHGAIDLWANASGQASDEMTLNFQVGDAQAGRPYAIIAQLYLPTLWSEASARALKLGLSEALCRHFQVAPSDVVVIAHAVAPGQVVEGGQVIDWPECD